MNNQLTEFVNPAENFHIRRVEHAGADWFVARDICDALGIDETATAVERLDADETEKIRLIDAVGREQSTFVVNESGMYAIVLRSNKPQAKAFRKWITSEVLPALRKTGSYSLADKLRPEALRVRQMELQLAAAKLREEAGRLEWQAEAAACLPNGEAISVLLARLRPGLARQALSQLSRVVRDWALRQGLPVGKGRSAKGGTVNTMLPEDVEAYFALNGPRKLHPEHGVWNGGNKEATL